MICAFLHAYALSGFQILSMNFECTFTYANIIYKSEAAVGVTQAQSECCLCSAITKICLQSKAYVERFLYVALIIKVTQLSIIDTFVVKLREQAWRYRCGGHRIV